MISNLLDSGFKVNQGLPKLGPLIGKKVLQVLSYHQNIKKSNK